MSNSNEPTATRWRYLGLLWLTCAWLLLPQQADALTIKGPFKHSAFDVVGGGSGDGIWGIRAQGGFPWQALQVQRGLPGGWTPFVEVDTALFVRTRPSLGLALRWLDTERFRITGEVMFGWDIQTGNLALQGPSITLRLRAMVWWNRVGIFLRVDTRHTLLFNQTVVDTANGEISRPSLEHRWSPWASLGLAVRLYRHISLDVEMVYPWIDAPSIPIPGFQLGLHIGFN